MTITTLRRTLAVGAVLLGTTVLSTSAAARAATLTVTNPYPSADGWADTGGSVEAYRDSTATGYHARLALRSLCDGGLCNGAPLNRGWAWVGGAVKSNGPTMTMTATIRAETLTASATAHRPSTTLAPVTQLGSATCSGEEFVAGATERVFTCRLTGLKRGQWVNFGAGVFGRVAPLLPLVEATLDATASVKRLEFTS